MKSPDEMEREANEAKETLKRILGEHYTRLKNYEPLVHSLAILAVIRWRNERLSDEEIAFKLRELLREYGFEI